MKFFAGLQSLFHSIRFKLVLWYTAILALVLLVFSVFILFNQSHDIEAESYSRLERRLAEIDGHGPGMINPGEIRLLGSEIFVLVGEGGNILAKQGVDTDAEALALVTEMMQSQLKGRGRRFAANDAHIIHWGPAREDYIFLAQPVKIGKGNGLALLGEPYDSYHLLERLILELLIGCGLTLAIAIGGGLWLADRAMRPIQDITRTAQTISETDLNRRLNLHTKDELGQLADTFDGMLARLQAAFERQRQFIADASHELRTPLTIVGLEANRILTGKRRTQEYQRSLEVIRSENDFMTHLVNDLLTLVRLDASQTSLEKEPLDLSEIAVEALERLAPLAKRYTVTLATGDLPETPIIGDRRALLQMISNLLENGIKYTGGEHKLVRIETGQDAGHTWVRVSDTGAGIAAEDLPHIFERFYRADKARTRSRDESITGSGLGLSIVQWIAQAHGATIAVNSTPGSGSTFEIRF